jgi:hypothetical protein
MIIYIDIFENEKWVKNIKDLQTCHILKQKGYLIGNYNAQNIKKGKNLYNGDLY